MDNKITIIEGPTPIFEASQDAWAMSLSEGPFFYDMAITRLRTFNGNALVERCHRAWRHGETMFLEYRSEIGLTRESTIMAVRNIESPDGNILLLWVRRDPQDAKAELGENDHEEPDDTP